MKFFTSIACIKKKGIFLIFILNLISTLRVPQNESDISQFFNLTAKNFPPGPNLVYPKPYYEVDHLVNRGYSLLADQSSCLERPASCLGLSNIFNYQVNLTKMMHMNVIPVGLHFQSNQTFEKGMKTVKEYHVKEIADAQDFAIWGNYKVPNTNYLYQRSRTIKHRHKKKTLLYFSEKQEFKISINNRTNFPMLSPVFIADAFKTFFRPEVQNFENQEKYVDDALTFLHQYGTHFIKTTKWGTRTVFITEVKLKKEDLVPSNRTAKTDSHIQSGSIGLEANKDNQDDRFKDLEASMQIGNCLVDTFKHRFIECRSNVTSYGLIGYEVDYLYNVFNTADKTGPIELPDKSQVTPDKISVMYRNMKNIIDGLENALYARNSVISDLVVYNNLKLEDRKHVACLENPKTKRYSKYLNSLFSDEFKVEKLHPIFKLSSKDYVNYIDLALFNKKELSTFACAYKKFNFNSEDIFSAHYLNKKYLKGIKISNKTQLNDTDIKHEECQNLWVKNQKNGNSNDITLLCLNKTSNFMDPDLIVDIKVKTFKGDKCAPFTYNERKYFCICEKDLVEISKKSKLKRFLCYAKKSTK